MLCYPIPDFFQQVFSPPNIAKGTIFGDPTQKDNRQVNIVPEIFSLLTPRPLTVSTVSVGNDADINLMKNIAKWENGRSYYTEDSEKIPRIFVSEIQIAAKKVIVEKTLKPKARLASDLTKGIPTGDLPLLQGQVITYPKPGAMILFETGGGPLLSAWQYGLGRSVAFTSDLSPRWGKSWILWEHYGAFVSQMVKWAKKKETPLNYQVAMERKGGWNYILMDVTDDRGLLINLLDLKMDVLFPSKKNTILSINQIAPGRYEGAFQAEEVGVYYLSLYSTDSQGGPSGPKIFGYSVPYTDEFKEVGVNQELLSSLATLTQGHILDVNSPPKGLFNTDATIKEVGPPLWPYLTLFPSLLLILDVGIRKLYSTGYFGDKQR